MEAKLVRLIWSVVHEVPASFEGIPSLAQRVSAVVSELDSRVTLSHQERQQICQYLRERHHLIQTLLQE